MSAVIGFVSVAWSLFLLTRTILLLVPL